MTYAAYPGSFNPLTVAHLAIANATRRQCALERVDLLVSRVALGKEHVERPAFEDRLAVLEAASRSRPWLGVRVTEAQLLADVAVGYDALVVGADKWAQMADPAWYGDDVGERDRALARLPPRVLVVPRPPHPLPDCEVLVVEADHARVSATAARNSRRDWMAPEAIEFDDRTGAWSDAARYDRWRLDRERRS